MPLERAADAHAGAPVGPAMGRDATITGESSHSHRVLLVADFMAKPLVTVSRGQTKADVTPHFAIERHNSFPVIAPDGTLDGLLLKAEMEHFDETARVEDMADRAPATVGLSWPIERAHRMFIALGLRHLLVCERDGRPIGMLTRHDRYAPKEHPEIRAPHPSRRSGYRSDYASSNEIRSGSREFASTSDEAGPVGLRSPTPGASSSSSSILPEAVTNVRSSGNRQGWAHDSVSD